jgi:acyl-CoA carboxylase subunit beta
LKIIAVFSGKCSSGQSAGDPRRAGGHGRGHDRYVTDGHGAGTAGPFTGEQAIDGIAVGRQVVGGSEVVAVTFDFAHHGGTLTTRNVPHLVAAADRALRLRVPLVSFVASGGVRVQQGMAALAGLQQVAAAAVRLRRGGIPHVVVLRGPVAGGAWAAFAGVADIVLARAGAQVGFAGSRVRPPGEDPAAYTAEAKWAAGEADATALKSTALTSRRPGRHGTTGPPGTHGLIRYPSAAT